MGAELFHADGRAGMTKLTIAFRNFAKEPKITERREKTQISGDMEGTNEGVVDLIQDTIADFTSGD